MEMQQQQQRLIPKEHKNLAKGFVLGFIAAQFVSGWVSYPSILIILILYVFMGHATRYIIDTILARIPGIAFLIKFITSYKAVANPTDPAPFASPFDTPDTNFVSPFQQPNYYSVQGMLV